MKHILIFFASCFFAYASSFAQKTVAENKDIYASPILLQLNDTVIVESDTL
jgi:hypothetical protein